MKCNVNKSTVITKFLYECSISTATLLLITHKVLLYA